MTSSLSQSARTQRRKRAFMEPTGSLAASRVSFHRAKGSCAPDSPFCGEIRPPRCAARVPSARPCSETPCRGPSSASTDGGSDVNTVPDTNRLSATLPRARTGSANTNHRRGFSLPLRPNASEDERKRECSLSRTSAKKGKITNTEKLK